MLNKYYLYIVVFVALLTIKDIPPGTGLLMVLIAITDSRAETRSLRHRSDSCIV